MPNGIPEDSPEEYIELYRAQNYVYVTMKYTMSSDILHALANRLVFVFETVFNKLSNSDSKNYDENIDEIKKKYPDIFEEYFEVYHFLKTLSKIEVDKITVDEKKKFYEYEVDGKKIHLTPNDVVKYLNKVESFYELAKKHICI